MIKSVVIICDQSPVGKNSVIESIRLGSGFLGLGEEIDCKLVFMGDAIYILNKHADPTVVGMDSFEEPLEMADLSDLEIYIVDSELQNVGLTKDDLIEYENLHIVNFEHVINLIKQADTTFRY